MNRRGSSVMDCVSTWSAREFRASEAKKHHEASQSEQHLPTALRQKATGDLVPPARQELTYHLLKELMCLSLYLKVNFHNTPHIPVTVFFRNKPQQK